MEGRLDFSDCNNCENNDKECLNDPAYFCHGYKPAVVLSAVEFAEIVKHMGLIRGHKEAAKLIESRDAAQRQAGREEAGEGAARILSERKRQIEKEGWTPEHDDAHDNGELAKAACAYALGDARFYPKKWTIAWWKTPRKPDGTIDHIRELEKAGALIAAEIDRLIRRDKEATK